MSNPIEIFLINDFGKIRYKEHIIDLFNRTEKFDPFEIEWLEEQLELKNDNYFWVIMVENEYNTVAGAACYGPILKERPGKFDLYWIAIDPDYQGKGYGKILLKDTEENAKEDGATHLYVETGSFNDSGNALYKSAGYKLMGVIEEYYFEDSHKHIWGKKL